MCKPKLLACLLAVGLICGTSLAVSAQRGQTDWNKPFPPHKVIGNVYFVGSEQLASFLITTSEGHILINSGFETTVPVIRAAVEKQEGGRPYDVVIVGSVGVNAGVALVNNKDYPQIAEDYMRSFKVLRGLTSDVFLGPHGSFYRLTDKYAQLEKGGANPFIDPQGLKNHLDAQEKSFLARLEEQKAAAR